MWERRWQRRRRRVRVAMEPITACGLKRSAYRGASHCSTRRPSASVWRISTVWPRVVTISPGRSAPPSACSRRSQDAHQADQEQFQYGAQGAEHAGGAAHVVLHLVHAQARLEADTAGVEGEGLDQQARVASRDFAAVVLHHADQARLSQRLAHGEVERSPCPVP